MILDRLTERARKALALLPRRKRISSGKILVSIRKVGGMGNLLLQNLPKTSISQKKQINIADLIKEAYYQSVKYEHTYVGTEHLLLALLKIIDSDNFNKARLELLKVSVFPNTSKPVDKDKKTPILDSFGENLNHKTLKNLDKPLIYRDSYNALVSALLLKNTSNVLLVGETGVGKKTLVEFLARNIASLDVPPALAGYQIIEFDILAFMTNLFNKGGVEPGLSQLSDELKSLSRVIIFIRNFQNIFFATASGLTVPVFYSMFKSTIDSAGVRMIATMNSSVHEKIFSENEHILGDFATISVDEPDEKETLKILSSMALYLSEYHNIEISKEAVKEIYKRAKDIDGNVKFPQKGVDFMDHCCTYVIMKKSKIPRSYKKMVDENFDLINDLDRKISKGSYEKAVKIRDQIKRFDARLSSKEEKIFVKERRLKLGSTDINEALSAFKDDRKVESEKVNISKLSSVADKIKRSIIGQDGAVDTVVKSLLRSKLGLRAKKRPLGNFLFLGPTGVGKTELAKVLADRFFGEKSLIRLDMSDFGEKHTVARLVGAPPGYVGYGEGGELTSKIDANPDSVVLFDEIEKAHPDVLNILLQIMEEAELTDAKGTLFDFSKAVIVLTSNLGTEILHNAEIGFEEKDFSEKKVETRLKNNLKKILKPELLNRFDEIIIFKRLGREEQLKILDLLLKEVLNTLKRQNISLSMSKDVKEYLLKTGYSDEYGARALRRTMEKEFLDKIAQYLLLHRKRPLNINASFVDGGVEIRSKRPS
jgi:ATP-dependent Clp protease ATP-binding subunit ClpC